MIEIMNTIKLHIETDQDTYHVGDEITVHVRDEKGHPVAGVTVHSLYVDGNDTDATGKTTITIQRTGTIDLIAAKQDTENATYTSASKLVEVRSA